MSYFQSLKVNNFKSVIYKFVKITDFKQNEKPSHSWLIKFMYINNPNYHTSFKRHLSQKLFVDKTKTKKMIDRCFDDSSKSKSCYWHVSFTSVIVYYLWQHLYEVL